MDKGEAKSEKEIAREAVYKYKTELLSTIDGYPEEVTHDALQQILRIVRLEKAKVDDEFRLKI